MIQYILILVLQAAEVFLVVINLLILIEVVLSWLTLLGVQIIIGPLRQITQPLYNFVRKHIPTTLGMIDFAPIIIYMTIIYIAIPGLRILQNIVTTYITF